MSDDSTQSPCICQATTPFHSPHFSRICTHLRRIEDRLQKLVQSSNHTEGLSTLASCYRGHRISDLQGIRLKMSGGCRLLRKWIAYRQKPYSANSSFAKTESLY